ncbi:MAG: glycosyltransferase family 4 protein [Candidatus Nitrosopelagicus sp.]|nr:glycosyltransferase family 4 protein [Candidatus Nitrosopelagicus sp.]
MKLLIGASSSKIFHLNEFAENLEKNNVRCKVVFDSEYADGFPSRKIKSWFSSNKKFKKLIDDFQPDVIFVDRTRHFAIEAAKTDIPLILHLRGNIWKEFVMARETLYKSKEKRIALNKWEEMGEESIQKSELILPICNHLSDITKEKYPNKKTETLYQGITPENWFQKKGMELKHPCVGILQSATIWEKTKEMLILPEILEKMPNVHFYWAGDGVYKDEILPTLEKYENFHWLGSLEYPDKVREFLTEIDVYALISGIDMSPLTLQEAQLMEKAVVATNVGGIPELMKDGETGYLIEKDNPEELFEKLSILLNNLEKTKEIGKKGKEFVTKNFSWDKICNDFLNHLKKHSIGHI